MKVGSDIQFWVPLILSVVQKILTLSSGPVSGRPPPPSSLLWPGEDKV